jgi:hypothetical protein
MKLRLSHVLDTLPRYQNNFSKGPYKNGNYARVTIIVGFDRYAPKYDANEFPRELLEPPYYVTKIYPVVLSAYGNDANTGLYIVLDKENNNYDR